MIGELKFGKCALGRDEKPIGHNHNQATFICLIENRTVLNPSQAGHCFFFEFLDFCQTKRNNQQRKTRSAMGRHCGWRDPVKNLRWLRVPNNRITEYPGGNPRPYAEISMLSIIYLPNIPTNAHQNLVQKKILQKNYPRKNLSKVVENTVVDGRKLVYKLRLTNIALWEQTVPLKEHLS